jgi:teichuronic acid biosynthesis glycosyltransferase TuaC
VEGLRARGVDIDVLMVGGLRRKASYLEGARRFLGQVRQKRYDLIHAHYVFCGVIALLRSFAGVTARRIPILLTHHGIEVLQGWTAPLSWVLSRLVDGVIVTSAEMKAALGLAQAHVIPCGVDLELFQPMPQPEAREKLALPVDKKLVLYVGLLRPEKRLDVIQAAVGLLQRDDPNVELVMASGLPHEKIPWYMNACDVLALASDCEGSPMVIKEAMACSLPIVSVDVGDVSEVIGGTEGCYLCQRDPADMAEKLRWALHRGQRTAGRAAVQRLALDAAVAQILHVYEELG